MEKEEILQLWNQHNEKIEASIALNTQNTRDLLGLKAKSLLTGMMPLKLFTVGVGIVWVGIGGIILFNLFMYAYSQVSLTFLYSATIQVLITAAAVAIYLYQLIMIQHIDISESVISVQRKLSYLKGSTLWCAKILFLQVPCWTTFHLSAQEINSGNILYIFVNGIFVALSIYAAIWMFVNIDYKNRDKKWFRLLFEGREWSPVIRSIEFYREIGDYEHEPALSDESRT